MLLKKWNILAHRQRRGIVSSSWASLSLGTSRSIWPCVWIHAGAPVPVTLGLPMCAEGLMRALPDPGLLHAEDGELGALDGERH